MWVDVLLGCDDTRENPIVGVHIIQHENISVHSYHRIKGFKTYWFSEFYLISSFDKITAIFQHTLGEISGIGGRHKEGIETSFFSDFMERSDLVVPV